MSRRCLYNLNGAVIRSRAFPSYSLLAAESLLDVCQEVNYILRAVVQGQKQLIVQFPFKGSIIRIDLSDPKTTSVICAVSIGFGLGSYLLYKLYCRFVQPYFKKPPDGPAENSDLPRTANKYTDTNHVEEETVMGNSGSNLETLPVHYSRTDGVVFGLKERSPNIPMVSKSRQRRRRVNHRRKSSIEKSKVSGANKYSRWKESAGTSGSSEDDTENVLNISHDGTNENECGSLKGNLSIRSLSERNLKYGIFDNQYSVSKNDDVFESSVDASATSGDTEANTTKSNTNGMDISAILLTPPSEDDVIAYANISKKHEDEVENKKVLDIIQPCPESYVSFATPSTGEHTSASEVEENVEKEKDPCQNLAADNSLDNKTQQLTTSSSENTGSSSSPYKSASSRVLTSDDISLDDEEYDRMSPLRSELKSDKGFQQSLLHRLHEYATEPSNSTSLESTPDISPYHRTSLGGFSDRQESFSDIATSDSEIFNVESQSSCAEMEFSKIEGEIHDLDDEFLSLNSKITELMSRTTITEGELQTSFSPASPLARKACDFVEKKKVKLSNSRASSLSPSDNSSFSPRHVSGSGPDLSWEYYDMNPKNLPKDSNLKEESECELPIEDDGHTSCEDFLECDGLPATDQRRLKGSVQIGEMRSILDYAESEWKGDTPTAQTIRKAYQNVPKMIHCRYIYQIRGDNYCGIRGTLFQCLTFLYSPLSRWSSVDKTIEKLNEAFHSRNSGLQNWTFANRLPYDGESLLTEMTSCIRCLFEKFEEAERINSYNERKQWTINCLNFDPVCDVKLMEGIKLLLLLDVLQLHEDCQSGKEVPMFVWLLFARDSSENPVGFVKNHLNCVGDSAGLEQVEMCLLGHTLGVTIEVLRLLQYDKEDFVSYFPDDDRGLLPQISLLAEDDRHYNAPTP